jgi:hypothetical protein
MNLETKWVGQVVASAMVVENGAIASANIFLLTALTEPDYFGTAHLQVHQRVMLHWHGSEKKGDCGWDSWVWLVVWSWPFFCCIMACWPWLMAVLDA